MLDNIQKITRVLLTPTKNLTLKMHTKLFNDKEDGRKENFHNEFSYGSNGYLKLDIQSFLTLEITGGEWSKDKSIVITQQNLYQIIDGFRQCVKNIKDGGVFALSKERQLIIYADAAEQGTVKIFNIGPNQRIILKPAIIYDSNETSYEGAHMFINNMGNIIDLPFDAIESILYKLEQTDLFVYSQLMINYYTILLNKIGGKPPESKPQYQKRKSVFDLPQENKEAVSSTLQTPQTDEEFFGI